jgi:methionyl-tRNA synthetase
MAQAKPKFYLTTPIYYTNGLPHIGHTYTTVVADTVRRYKRMQGYEVVMTTGTDEHGVNVERAAQKAGVPESEFVAKMAEAWRALWEELGVSADEFIRTTEVRHARTVQWLFKLFRENGFVYPGHYTGQYCIYDNAYVDVKPGENCPDCGRPTETVTEENYFFKLSAFQQPLLDLYRKNPTGNAAQRNSELRRRRPSRSEHYAHVHSLGHSRPRRREARFLRLVRRVDGLPECGGRTGV